MPTPIFGDKLSAFHDVAYSNYTQDDISKILALNQTLPVSIASFKIQGAGRRTRSSFLKAQVDSLINAQTTLTLPELLKELDATADRFRRFGTYSSVEFKLDLATVTPYKALLAAQDKPTQESSNPLYEPYRGIKPLDLKATLLLALANPHPVHLQSVVRDNGPAAFTLSAALKNLFGGAETLSAQLTKESLPSAVSSYAAEFSAPLCIRSPDTRVHLSAFQTATASKIQGGTLKLVSKSPANPASFSEFGVSAVQRGLLNDAKDSLKTSVFSRFTIDRRTASPDAPLYVDGGYLVDWHTELAGIGAASKLSGDVSFLKTEASAQLAKTLDPASDHVVFNAAAGTGLLWAYDRPGFSPTSTPHDRFFLGGPQGGSTASRSVPPGVLLHSYTASGLGPKDADNTPVGGDAYAAGTVSVLLKLPRATYRDRAWAAEFLAPLRVLAYFSQASVVQFADAAASDSDTEIINADSTGGGAWASYKSVFAAPTTSAGLGLVYKTPAAQLELVYSAPFVVPASEKGAVRQGWQLAVGFDVDL